MEHIFQVAIGVDDEGIKKSIAEKAEKVILDGLKQDVLNRVFEAKFYNRDADPKRDKLSELTADLVVQIFQDCRESIIARAGEVLADRMSRSKIVREKVVDAAAKKD